MWNEMKKNAFVSFCSLECRMQNAQSKYKIHPLYSSLITEYVYCVCMEFEIRTKRIGNLSHVSLWNSITFRIHAVYSDVKCFLLFCQSVLFLFFGDIDGKGIYILKNGRFFGILCVWMAWKCENDLNVVEFSSFFTFEFSFEPLQYFRFWKNHSWFSNHSFNLAVKSHIFFLFDPT